MSIDEAITLPRGPTTGTYDSGVGCHRAFETGGLAAAPGERFPPQDIKKTSSKDEYFDSSDTSLGRSLSQPKIMSPHPSPPESPSPQSGTGTSTEERLAAELSGTSSSSSKKASAASSLSGIGRLMRRAFPRLNVPPLTASDETDDETSKEGNPITLETPIPKPKDEPCAEIRVYEASLGVAPYSEDRERSSDTNEEVRPRVTNIESQLHHSNDASVTPISRTANRSSERHSDASPGSEGVTRHRQDPLIYDVMHNERSSRPCSEAESYSNAPGPSFDTNLTADRSQIDSFGPPALPMNKGRQAHFRSKSSGLLRHFRSRTEPGDDPGEDINATERSNKAVKISIHPPGSSTNESRKPKWHFRPKFWRNIFSANDAETLKNRTHHTRYDMPLRPPRLHRKEEPESDGPLVFNNHVDFFEINPRYQSDLRSTRILHVEHYASMDFPRRFSNSPDFLSPGIEQGSPSNGTVHSDSFLEEYDLEGYFGPSIVEPEGPKFTPPEIPGHDSSTHSLGTSRRRRLRASLSMYSTPEATEMPEPRNAPLYPEWTPPIPEAPATPGSTSTGSRDWYETRMDMIMKGEGNSQGRDSTFELDVPEHFPGSPLCPLSPLHKSRGMAMCPYHGRRSTLFHHGNGMDPIKTV